MYPKPLHQIINDYKKREQEGSVVKRVVSPTIKNNVKPFTKVDNEKTKRK